MMGRLTVILLGSALALVPPDHAGARVTKPACELGWFVIDGAAADTARTGQPSTAARVVSIVRDKVSIDGLCGETTARVRRGRSRTTLRASWDDCPGISGKVRLRAAIARGCATMRGTLNASRGRPKRQRFTARRTLGETTDCTNEDTIQVLQRRIFGPKGCRVASCHGEFKAGGLDLRWGAAHASLVDQPATSPGSAGRKRVVPGDPEASFLWRKLTGDLGANEGTRMPAAGGSPLNALELELVRSWIENGALPQGRAGRVPCLPHPRFTPAEPLPVPPGGHQLVFEGPVLQPGEELEGCMWVRVPNTEEFRVGKWEYSINPGSHHFAVWNHERGPMPVLNEFDPKDLACFKQGAPIDGRTISGAPEAPYYVDDYPAGVGETIEAGKIVGINPHYFNEFDVPIQIKGWINLHPVEGTYEHEVETLFSSVSALEGRTAYGISVPPFTTGSLLLRMPNALARTMRIFHMSSHQHMRGTRFTAWNSAGEKIFENLDWAHPTILNFPAPYSLAPGDFIDFQCEWDNGVERAVRRCGDSPLDSGCTPGEPRAVTFGVTAQDEMCFLVGFYYLE